MGVRSAMKNTEKGSHIRKSNVPERVARSGLRRDLSEHAPSVSRRVAFLGKRLLFCQARRRGAFLVVAFRAALPLLSERALVQLQRDFGKNRAYMRGASGREAGRTAHVARLFLCEARFSRLGSLETAHVGPVFPKNPATLLAMRLSPRYAAREQRSIFAL